MKKMLALPIALGLTAALAATPAVQGTQQLKGGDGQLGKTYTLNLGTPQALNFTLNKVDYLAGRFLIDPGTPDERDYLQDSGKKLVVLHFTVQNPQKVKYRLRYDSVNIMGVDSNNKEVTRARSSGLYDEISRKTINMDLQPAQKVNAVVLLALDSRASLPKLMVEANKATKAVWRYNLAGKVTPVGDPFRDPSVADGSASLDQGIPLKLNYYVPTKEVDFKVTGLQYSPNDTLDLKVPAGGKILLINLSFRNPHFRPFRLGNAFPPVRVKVFDQDDIAGGQSGKLHFASRDQQLEGELNSGKELGVRLAVALPGSLMPKRLEFTDGLKRTYNIDLTEVK